MKSLGSLYASIQRRAKKYICEKRDFKTKRHIVVFESDDWGSIRMSNRKDWELLRQKGYAVEKRPYERYDTLESSVDLEALFEVLRRHKDVNGNHPIITANMLMANPDFEKIKASGFQEYYYEHITDTYTRYYGNVKPLEIMRQGMDEGLFIPQSHGREHFNVTQWLKGLQSGDEDLITAFRFNMCGISPKSNPSQGNKLMMALYANNEKEQQQIDENVVEGLRMFENFWGFKSKSFIAPCYCWSRQTESLLKDNDVKWIQASRISKPTYKTPSMFFYVGQQKSNGLYYGVRNCLFEPSTINNNNEVGLLMEQVDNIFSQHKIAIFSSHRINYVGGIDEMNRTRNLKTLNVFLTQLLQKYPDTIFTSSDKLLDIILEES